MSDAERVKRQWREMGERAASDPQSWVTTAIPLLLAADLCWQRYLVASEASRETTAASHIYDLMLLRVALLLEAQAIESLLKALILRAHPKAASTGEMSIYTHDLVTLARNARISVSDAEIDLLSKLREVVEWAGRYPIPKWVNEKDRARFDPQVIEHEGGYAVDGSTVPSIVSEAEWRSAEALVQRMRTELAF